MKRITAFLFSAVFVAAMTVCAFALTLDGTKIRGTNADPQLFYSDGNYYLTQTGTTQVAVFKASTPAGFGSLDINQNIVYRSVVSGVVYDRTVTALFGSGAEINGTWSPEIHYFSEEQFPGRSGYYMFLALRKKGDDSSNVRMVVLKSMTSSPKGPYGHPTTGEKFQSQPIVDSSGAIYDRWACGQTVLTIPEGEYKGVYTLFVAEEGRGGAGTDGTFYQKIMIAKMKSPWQFDGTPSIVTTPTQTWEYAGASSTHPRVVEGATAVYGKNGDIYLTYSGSGYWSDYGIGQLTWTGGNPLYTSSWQKLSTAYNPIFTATTAEDLRGAGHASFITDKTGQGFMCYHAYPYENGEKLKTRNAYIEPYYIDYTKWNGVSYGVITMGANKNGVAAKTMTQIDFNTAGSYLDTPVIDAQKGEKIIVTYRCSGADGYMLYRAEGTDGIYEYIMTTAETTYIDSDVVYGNTYSYKVYAYRNEEISEASLPSQATATVNMGDANYDAMCNLLDVILALKYTSGAGNDISLRGADMNFDGEITVSDVILLLRKVLG